MLLLQRGGCVVSPSVLLFQGGVLANHGRIRFNFIAELKWTVKKREDNGWGAVETVETMRAVKKEQRLPSLALFLFFICFSFYQMPLVPN